MVSGPESPPPSVPVRGIWLRTVAADRRYLEVLAETEQGWRLLFQTFHPDDSGPISHIAEPGGIRSAPPDPLIAALLTERDEVVDG